MRKYNKKQPTVVDMAQIQQFFVGNYNFR